jgi:hypothetical protein
MPKRITTERKRRKPKPAKSYKGESVDKKDVSVLQKEISISPTATFVWGGWDIEMEISGSVIIAGKEFEFRKTVCVRLSPKP